MFVRQGLLPTIKCNFERLSSSSPVSQVLTVLHTSSSVLTFNWYRTRKSVSTGTTVRGALVNSAISRELHTVLAIIQDTTFCLTYQLDFLLCYFITNKQGLNSVGAGGSWDPTPLTRAPTPHTYRLPRFTRWLLHPTFKLPHVHLQLPDKCATLQLLVH